MYNDYVNLDGKLLRWSSAGINPENLLGKDLLYQKIHVFEDVPLHFFTHWDIINTSCKTLYGEIPDIDPGHLEDEIRNVLNENRFLQGSKQVNLYILNLNGNEKLSRLLTCEKQLLYKGYNLWHKSLSAIIVSYETPFAPHKTSVSLAAHNFALRYAEMKSSDVAISENYRGIITGVGENPFFAVKDRTVYTAPFEEHIPESVERQLGIISSERAGYIVNEHPVKSSDVKEYDELFTVTPQGIVSIGSCSGKLFPNSSAKTIAAKMSELLIEKI